MPFLTIRTNVAVDDKTAETIKHGIGRAIECLPGKSEMSLLVEIRDGARLWLRGESRAPVVCLDAAVFGNEDHAGRREFTAEATRILCAALGVAPENVFVNYADIPAWGVAGMTFVRIVGGAGEGGPCR